MVEIYTDGSYKQGRGSWAFVIVKNGIVTQEASGRSKKTSSHRMEFQAAIEAIRSLDLGTQAQLYTDSKILVNTINVWMPEWHMNRWLKKNDRPIPNLDLVKALYALHQMHSISWEWVKAHSGNTFNERCDQLCLLARS